MKSDISRRRALAVVGAGAAATAAGTDPDISDPVVVLIEELMALRRDYEAFADVQPGAPEYEKGEALVARIGTVESELLETTPTTPIGLALLWQFLEADIDHEPHQTCIRNLRKAIGQLAVPWLEDATVLSEVARGAEQ